MQDEARITRALRRRGTTMLCPACGFALRGPIGRYRLVPDDARAAAESVGGLQGVKVTVYACSNCGYLRLHSANVISDATDGPT